MDVRTLGLIIAIVIAAVAFYQKVQHRREGSTVSRSRDFVAYSETFTLRHISDEEFRDAIEAASPNKDTGASMRGNASRVVFEGPFRAELVRTEQSDEKTVYTFRFTNWSSRYGVATREEDMNLLLTAIERMFVSLDPETKVTSKKEDVTTKRSIL